MKVQNTKEQIDKAKAKGEIAFVIGIDGRMSNKSPMLSCSGTCNQEEADQIVALIQGIRTKAIEEK